MLLGFQPTPPTGPAVGLTRCRFLTELTEAEYNKVADQTLEDMLDRIEVRANVAGGQNKGAGKSRGQLERQPEGTWFSACVGQSCPKRP